MSNFTQQLSVDSVPFLGKHLSSRYIISENAFVTRTAGYKSRKKGSAPALILSTISQDRHIRILLADDDQDDRDIFAEAVSELNVKVELNFVKDGQQLMNYLTKATDELPDIVFLDLNMPAKDGKECLKEIRTNNAFKDLPIVIYTTTNSLRDVDETHSLGANLFVRKPTSFKEVVQLARKILGINWAEHKPNVMKKNYVFSLK